MEEKKIKCSICGKEISFMESNNAQPINDGRCCSECDRQFVVPIRMKRGANGANPYKF